MEESVRSSRVTQQVVASVSGAKNLLPTPEPISFGAWRPDLAVLAYATFDGPLITLHNVRNATYFDEDEYDLRHYDLQFRLDAIRTVDFVVVPFRDAPLLAHTMLSFGLSDGRHFVVSVEARLEQGETYSPVQGTLKKYELMYVVADEEDVIPLRTNVRQVDVFLFQGAASPEQAQHLLVDILQRLNSLSREPEFYDSLRNNCTTNLVQHVNTLSPGKIRLDYRVLLPGHSDSLAYELGLIETQGLSFSDLKRTSKINAAVRSANPKRSFSRQIREAIGYRFIE